MNHLNFGISLIFQILFVKSLYLRKTRKENGPLAEKEILKGKRKADN